MSRAPSTFRQRDLTAAIKAARAAGVEVAKVKVGKDGAIKLKLAKKVDGEADSATEPTNEWDKA